MPLLMNERQNLGVPPIRGESHTPNANERQTAAAALLELKTNDYGCLATSAKAAWDRRRI